MSCSYENVIPLYIYDIQITEDYNYNLLEGDTEEVVVTAPVSNNNYYKEIQISKALSVGKKITVKVDGMENLIGESDEYLINLKQGNAIVASSTKLNSSYKIHVFTVNDKYDPVGEPVCLILYAGKENTTAGNSVKYSNVQLLEGEYAWNVLGEDVDELTVEAGESSNGRIGILIQNKLTVGGKYTITVDDVINLKGEETKYTILIQQNIGGALSQISNAGVITQNNKSIILTINDKYIPDDDPIITLFIYAGLAGSTAGNTVQFKNVRLLYGETVLPSMPSYTPHFIPSAPDIEVASEAIQLPEGYRPDVQGKTINHEFALTSEMPAYNVKVVTPYGDDSDVISIPNNVKLFPAWIQVDVAGIGTLDNPEKYFSADWGNGLKGMNVLLDADDIGLGVQEVEPDVVEGMEHVKYAASGVLLPTANLEDFVEGSRIVVEVPPNIPNRNAYINIRKNGVGLLMLYNPNGNVSLFIYGYNERMPTIIKGVEDVIQRYELRIGATLEECQLFLNGKLYTGTFGNVENGGGDTIVIDADSRASLIEIYSPESVLLHKWDFEGSSIDEIFSDKANTENKINFIKGGEYKLIPV